MRVVGYVRCSNQEQVSGYSLDAQRRAIRELVATSGHELVGECSDEGRSAATDRLDKRPGFRAAVDAVTSGQAEAIVVHKLDRAARNLQVLLQVLQQTGGALICVTERTDYSTPQGKFFVHMLGVLAQFYSDNLSQETKKGQLERLRQGLYHGHLPFGLRRNPGDDHGRLPPVPDSEPVLCTIADRREWSRFDALQYLFQRAAAGASCPTLVREMADTGFPVTISGLWHILNNRFYLGELPVRDPQNRRRFEWLPGAHDAVIDPSLFERAAAARQQNKRGSGPLRRSAHAHPLTGLARCARCGGPLHCRTRPTADRTGATRHLYCPARRDGDGCDQPGIRTDPIEAQCLEYLQMVTPPADVAAAVAERLRENRQDTRRERTSLERRLGKLRDLYVWGDLEQREYLGKKEELERQLALCEPAGSDRRVTEQLIRYLEDLPAGYADALPEERNAILRQLFTVLVIDGTRLARVGFQPVYDGMLAAWSADTFGLPRQSETVRPLTRTEDGLWLVPPLEIAQRLRPYIPREYWPTLLRERDAGTSVQELASRWDVAPMTMWHTLAKARAESTVSTFGGNQ